MRTWSHLPTYDDQLKYWQSNLWNYPKADAAYGNIGVIYNAMGYPGAGMDAWIMGTKVNPEYDVPHYNLSSQFRSRGMLLLQNGHFEEGLNNLKAAYPFLEKAVNCKICHFRDTWKRELNELKAMIDDPKSALFTEQKRQLDLMKSLEERRKKSTDKKDIEGIDISIRDCSERIMSLGKILGNVQVMEGSGPPIQDGKLVITTAMIAKT